MRMPRPVESGQPDIHQLTRRVEDCDTYHMAFDGVAREFHAQVAASATDGVAVGFEQFFDDMEQAQRTELLLSVFC